MSTRCLSVVACLLAVLVSSPDTLDAQTLSKTLVASGLGRPVFVISPPDDAQRLMIVEQGNSSGLQARIRLIKNGTLQATPFLNIDSLVSNSGNERGLLGLAFHPNYSQNGYFYVNYTATNGATTIRRYTRSATNPDIANASSGLTLLTISQPYSNHNGGMIAFGPDGYLYIGTGDGGSGNDPGNRAQNLSNLLGKMLRIDVDSPSGGLQYGIPSGNPLVGLSGRDEVYHWGLRNPWRFSFDRETGGLYIGDVGQNAREEISYAGPGVGGRNFGWRCMEANRCTGLSGCTCFSASLTPPIHEYTQGSGTGWCITGGYVYRGCAIPSLRGTYFFADYTSNRIWRGTLNAAGTSLTGVTNISSQLGSGLGGVAAFGEDASGELYIVSRDGGTVYRITSASSAFNLIVSGQPNLGSAINLSLVAPGNQSRPYLLGLALSTNPGITLSDGRVIPLTLDPLLTFALTVAPNGLYNPFGTLNAFTSSAIVPMAIPNLPVLTGTTVWAAYVVANPAASAGIQGISCSVGITMQ